MIKINKFLVLPIFLLLTASLACGLFGGDDTESAAPIEQPVDNPTPVVPQEDEEVVSEPTDLSEAIATEEADPEAETDPDPVFGPGPDFLDLDDPLIYQEPEGINTYKTLMDYRFSGISSDDLPITGTIILDGSHSVEPRETDLIFQSFGSAVLGEEEVFTFTQVHDTEYIYTPETGCFISNSGEIDNPFTDFLDTGGIFTGNAQRILPDEVVNGIDTFVFEITNQNIGESDPDSFDIKNIEYGRFYVSKEDDFVTRIIIEGVGVTEVLSGESSLEGDVTYQVDYYDIDAPVDINPPAVCLDFEETEGDYPVLEDAYNIIKFTGMMSYNSEVDFDEAVEFYKSELEALGYSVDEEFVFGGTAILSFSDTAGKDLQITIGGDPGTGELTIVIIDSE